MKQKNSLQKELAELGQRMDVEQDITGDVQLETQQAQPTESSLPSSMAVDMADTVMDLIDCSNDPSVVLNMADRAHPFLVMKFHDARMCVASITSMLMLIVLASLCEGLRILKDLRGMFILLIIRLSICQIKQKKQMLLHKVHSTTKRQYACGFG